MRVTLLGHASVLVELTGATVLMDPVLMDPFEEGTVVSCPRRTIDLDALPPIDIVVVSHRHPDHFDLPSLALLDRGVDAICPGDPLIVYGLKQLGFQHVHPVQPMAPVLGHDFELFPTRSELTSIPEFGLVFHDESGTFWNQVDTPLSDETIDAVRHHIGPIDLLFAMYASQNFEFFESRSTTFPAETHRRNLETSLRIAPAVVTPASAGFRFAGEHEWLNAFLFPIARERFAYDLRSVAPQLVVTIMNPGDTFELADGHVKHRRAASTYARTEVDDTARLRFEPTASIPPLRDDNPTGRGLADLETIITRLLAFDLAHFVRTRQAAHAGVLDAYARHGVRYQIEVVFPDGPTRWFQYRFDGAGVEVVTGAGEAPADAHLVHRIAASALAGWVEHSRSFFSVRAASRRHGELYELQRNDAGVGLRPVELPDLLMYYVLRVAPGSDHAARDEVDQQLLQLGTEPRLAR